MFRFVRICYCLAILHCVLHVTAQNTCGNIDEIFGKVSLRPDVLIGRTTCTLRFLPPENVPSVLFIKIQSLSSALDSRFLFSHIIFTALDPNGQTLFISNQNPSPFLNKCIAIRRPRDSVCSSQFINRYCSNNDNYIATQWPPGLTSNFPINNTGFPLFSFELVYSFIPCPRNQLSVFPGFTQSTTATTTRATTTPTTTPTTTTTTNTNRNSTSCATASNESSEFYSKNSINSIGSKSTEFLIDIPNIALNVLCLMNLVFLTVLVIRLTRNSNRFAEPLPASSHQPPVSSTPDATSTSVRSYETIHENQTNKPMVDNVLYEYLKN